MYTLSVVRNIKTTIWTLETRKLSVSTPNPKYTPKTHVRMNTCIMYTRVQIKELREVTFNWIETLVVPFCSRQYPNDFNFSVALLYNIIIILNSQYKIHVIFTNTGNNDLLLATRLVLHSIQKKKEGSNDNRLFKNADFK